jgi:hypothetical protein
VPARREDFFADLISFVVNYDDLNIQMPLSQPNEGDQLFGFDAQKLFSEPQGWMGLFQVSDTKNLLTECLHLIQASKRITKNFQLATATGETRLANVEFILEENGKVIRINLKPPEIKATQHRQLEKIESLELILMDSSALPVDPNAFLQGVTDAAKAAGIRVPPNGVQLIVIESEAKKVPFEKLVHSRAIGLLQKPIEMRRLLFLVSVTVQSPFSMYGTDNLNLKTDRIIGKMARDAKLVELGEFGCSFQSDHKLKPGTLLYLFQSIFANAPDQNLCVRVYHSEEDSAEPGKFINSVVYFGITDAFLKYTRSYIRETYASKKSKE